MAGRLLDWLGKKEKEARLVNEIHECKEVHTTASSIAGAFARFYRRLYDARPLAGETQVAAYLADIETPSMTRADRDALEEGNITLQEILDAINRQKSGKAPGPNGLPAEYFSLKSVY